MTTAESVSPATANEIRDFRAHPNLLWDVITRQAGTLGKALLEGVTNSCDAKATLIEIALGPDSFTISDNGRGFADKAEITRVFEVFGEPHAEGDATYGRFRMGRGQLMAFARTEWRSNGSRMTVDIKKDGLRYEYSELATPEPGCRIVGELYERLSFSQMNGVVDEVIRDCKYIVPELRVNGKRVNEDPAKKKWPIVAEDFWGRVTAGGASGIDVYQQGVYVETIQAYEFGISGVVITKPGFDLRLNFARNQVIRSCPRFKRILAMLGVQSKKSLARRKTLDDSEVVNLTKQLASRDCYRFPQEYRGAAFIEDVTGRRWSYNQLDKAAKSEQFERLPTNKVGYTFCRRGDQKGDKLMQQHRLFVISEDTAEALNADPKTGFDGQSWFYRFRQVLQFVPFKQVKDAPTGSYRLLRDGELNDRERLMLSAIKDACNWRIRSATSPDGNWKQPRVLRVGVSDTADGWTDGSTYIAIDRDFLQRVDASYDGFMTLGLLLVHEYCHDDDSSETHVHSPEFYRRYHDASKCAVNFMLSALTEYIRVAGKLPHRAQRQAEKVEFAHKVEASTLPPEQLAASTKP